MLTLKIALICVATWRLYRLIALDTGPKGLLRRVRVRIGVNYKSNGDGSIDWSRWETEDGSLAEGLTCSKCSPIWWATILTIVMLVAPDWLFFLLTVPMTAAAFALSYENLVYAPHE